MSVEKKYRYITAEENVLNKDWAAGSSEISESTELIIKDMNYAKYIKTNYAPAWFKIVDEIIVNALDNIIRQNDSKYPVTKLDIKFDITGRITIINDGLGIDVELQKEATKILNRKEIYVPTLIFGCLNQGSNGDRNEESIIGGTNGLGAKICNIHSTEFIVETIDIMRKRHFRQKWRNNMKIEEKPTIKTTKIKKPYTKVEFVPDYANQYKYELISDSTKINKLKQDDFEELSNIIRTRAIFASTYANFVSKNKIKITYNNDVIKITSMKAMANLLFDNKCKIFNFIITPTNNNTKYKYPWDITVVCNNVQFDEELQHSDNNPFNFDGISCVNGIVVSVGKHIEYIKKKICEKVKQKMQTLLKDKQLKFSDNYISNNIYILINSQIPDPKWTGQRKDNLSNNIRNFSNYQISNNVINNIAKELKTLILEKISNKKTIPKKKPKSKIALDYEKYIPAKKAGTKEASKCLLIAVEGDSAMQQVATGVSNNFGFNYFGLLSVGGVIINVRKESDIIETSKGKILKLKTKLQNNKFIKMFSDITGLDTSLDYDPNTALGKKQINSLRYGGIVACVDQDLDGKGKILGLILNMFDHFWPKLLKNGYVKWLSTPIIRAYPKSGGKIKEFYNQAEYDSWKNNNNYNIRYYKGLGTHDRKEIINIFKNFYDNLFTYKLERECRNKFEIYFGKNSESRKIELSKPARNLPLEKQIEIFNTKKISCEDHLDYDSYQYQKDDLQRKLISAIDGQNQAGRKILDGILKALTNNKEMKVSQLAGYISNHENYHHGEASLEKSLTGKGFVSVGGKQLPFIVPLSNFGSRKGGGSDAASARYIWAKLNKQITSLLFPKEDYHLLEFNFDEGERSEPKYFVPIVPLAILESMESPSHGWKIKIWARDVIHVINTIRKMIILDDNMTIPYIPPTRYENSQYRWNGEFRIIENHEYSIGDYYYDEKANTIHITELPLRCWTNNFVNDLKKKALAVPDLISYVHDSSGDLNIDIEIELKPNALNEIESYATSYFDGITEYFKLRECMHSHINLMGKYDDVLCYDFYDEVIKYWFPIRKEYYAKRIERQRILYNLELIMYENIIRYIKQHTELKISTKSIAKIISILEQNNFTKLDHNIIKDPKFTPNDMIKKLATETNKCSYDYLIDLTDRKKSKESLQKYIKTYNEIENALFDLNAMATKGRFPGAVLWENELTLLEKAIIQGQRTFWKYKDHNKYKF